MPDTPKSSDMHPQDEGDFTHSLALAGPNRQHKRRHHLALRRYRNPLRGVQGLNALRIDMGVDYSASHDSPIYSPGPGRVVRLDTNSSWPGGHIICIEFTAGKPKGMRMYLAEHLTFPRHLKLGDHVTAKTRIATLHPGYPYCEIGWCKRGTTYPEAYGCYHEGQLTHAGINFSEFMHALGAPRGTTSGRNPVCPLPAGYPHW